MKYKTLKVKTQKRVGWVTINRPKKLNALNRETLAELHHALAILEEDNNVRLLVIRGAGDTAFVAGVDLLGVGDRFSGTGGGLGPQRNEREFCFI